MGGPQRARPHRHLHPATHPRRPAPGHGSTHATDSRCQDSRTTHMARPRIPAACSHPNTGRPGPPYPALVLPTFRPHPTTYHLMRDPPPGPAHRPPSTTPTRHAQAEQAPHTHVCQHVRTTSPHAPTPPSIHRYRQLPTTACPLCMCQRLPETALPCNPDHWVCVGAARRLTHCPHCGDLNPHHRTQPPPPPATAASSGDSLTPSRTTWEGTTWRTQRILRGP